MSLPRTGTSLLMSTVLVTAVTYLGFECRSVHDGDRGGFTVKPTAKYVDECLDKAVMTPLTEQKSLNLHGETTACDQVQHSVVQSSCRKTTVHYRSETRFDVCDKMFVIQTRVTYSCRFDACQESVEIFKRNT